ncbi:MAG: methylmalonyl-CoA mutase, partial [Caldithrix sp.]
AAKIALRTQQIIAHESGAADTVDPLGGSYFLENLTSDIEKRVWEYLDKIETMGGALKAIDNKFFKNEITQTAYEYQNSIESREKIIVGLNDFKEDEKEQPAILKVDPALRDKQIKKLQRLKERRDNEKVGKLLEQLKTDARGSTNLMPTIVECVEAYATLGEISDILREVFGKYKEI